MSHYKTEQGGKVVCYNHTPMWQIGDAERGKHLCEHLKQLDKRLSEYKKAIQQMQVERAMESRQVVELKADIRNLKAMLWAFEANTGKRAIDMHPNPWGMRNPYRKNNGCWFDGKPIPKEGQP